MKLTSNERLGTLLIIAILALVAICLILKQHVSAPQVSAPQVDAIILEAAPAEPVVKPTKAKKARKQTTPAPAPREPLDEVF